MKYSIKNKTFLPSFHKIIGSLLERAKNEGDAHMDITLEHKALEQIHDEISEMRKLVTNLSHFMINNFHVIEPVLDLEEIKLVEEILKSTDQLKECINPPTKVKPNDKVTPTRH